MSFYKCSKCKRIWQYPLSECPYCNIELDKFLSKQSKIITVSKVMIPTIRHPQVPYFACVVEDENNNKWVHKTIQEVKEGDDLVYEKSFDKNTVAIWRVKYDYVEAIEKSLDLIGGLDLKEDSKVLILPTLNSANQSYFRENTSPEFLSKVLEFILNKVKIENIKIATQSFSDLPIEAMAQRSGLLDVCMKNKIMPIDLSKSNFIKQGNLEITEEVLNADIVLNLAMLKDGCSMALENIFRVLKRENYMGLKYLKSEKEIAQELLESLDNLINLGEAEYIQTTKGVIAFLGVILVSRNFINIDRVLNEIISQKLLPKNIEDVKIENIPIAGRDIKELQFNINNI
ncbi:MAG: DUF362 domain-containing protein [Candidatus Paceibacterota bacterium]|jgi:uncharacterized protein (DUF362 family)